jgi:hypothetical protein
MRHPACRFAPEGLLVGLSTIVRGSRWESPRPPEAAHEMESELVTPCRDAGAGSGGVVMR